MEPAASIPQQPRRFFDGGVAARDDQSEVPPDDLADPRIVLERQLDGQGRERFLMLRRIGYLDREFGPLLVPATPDFLTDLASVPTLFTWLVPKTGAHLPAALLHDGLVRQGAFVSVDGRATGLTRVHADRIFRDAMADTGTPLVRRWLVWAAVATATMVHGRGAGWTPRERWLRRVTVLGSVALVAVLGLLATLDLLDVGAVGVPWMREAGLGIELAYGAAGAVLIPALLGLLWGRFRVAGWIVLVSLAVLLHVTVAIGTLFGLYQLLEWAFGRLVTDRSADPKGPSRGRLRVPG